ncbi:tetrahydrofolate dehydrogenase/cyclohydrolase catalytic domain-containing protein [Pseudovibrio sp. POLY-S9]|uniref:tetrahydrofolate dehydrogenase/cyclohydrolase catalytic domain-containing protein n=1 Tax=Pseudovibrio sp. POLY-S9 TaxID=1576596 RepID=UPI000A4245DD
MTQAQIICGKTLAAVIDEEVKEAIASLHTSFGKTAKLTVVVVGDDPASAIYVNNKVKRCRKVGIESQKLALDANITLADLTQVIRDLSAEPETHGILLQLPLPNGMNARKILHEIALKRMSMAFTHLISETLWRGHRMH